MELQVFQSILGQLSPNNITRERLGLLLSAVQDNQLLSFIFGDAENDLSETHQKSAELRNKWLRRTLELLGHKQEPSTRVCGLSLLQTTIPVVTYELTLAHYESWFAQLLGIISQKVRRSSASTILRFSPLRLLWHFSHLFFLRVLFILSCFSDEFVSIFLGCRGGPSVGCSAPRDQ
jgi:hypothetical protein